MSNQVIFSIAGHTFDPGPSAITLSDTYNRTESGELFSIIRTATIEGVLTSLRDTSCGQSIACTMSKINELDTALRGCDCTRMVLSCNGEVILDTNVRVQSVQFDRSNDNWVFTIPYNIQVEWMIGEDNYDSECLSCLTSIQNTWEIQHLSGINKYQVTASGCESENPTFISVNHTVSATAKNCCDTSGNQTPGWQVARDWVLGNIGLQPSGEDLEVSGVFSFDPSAFQFCDHIRVNNIDKLGGSYSVTESWTGVGNDGAPLCLEEFTIEHSQSSETYLNTYTISGTITGLEKRDENFSITETKFESAENCWTTVEPLLPTRVNCIASPACPINPFPTQKTIGRSPVAGTISYSYTYNDRPTALISGAISESITINDTLRAPRVQEVEIIGRAAGPILVSCNTTNAFNRSVSISAIVPRGGSGCPPTGSTCAKISSLLSDAPDTAVQDMLCCIQSGLEASYDFVYRNQDSRQWDPINGVYNRNVNFIVSRCNDSLPGGFCP